MITDYAKRTPIHLLKAQTTHLYDIYLDLCIKPVLTKPSIPLSRAHYTKAFMHVRTTNSFYKTTCNDEQLENDEKYIIKLFCWRKGTLLA